MFDTPQFSEHNKEINNNPLFVLWSYEASLLYFQSSANGLPILLL